MKQARTHHRTFFRTGRILAVYAAMFGAFAPAARGAGPANDVTWNPHGRFSDQNARVGNSYAGIAANPVDAGMQQAHPFGPDATAIENQLSVQTGDALAFRAYCDPSRTTAEDYAACRLAASLVEDTQAAANRVNLRTDVLADANRPAGTADLGHKLGEAARVSAWGATILQTQLRTIERVIQTGLGSRIGTNWASLGGPMDDRALDYLRNGVRPTVNVQAAILLTAEYRAMKQTADSFGIAADFNMKGTMTLANDVDDTDVHTQDRFGPVTGAASMGLGRQTAPVSTAPASGSPGPVKFASRMPASGGGAATTGDPKGVAIDPVGAPGTLNAGDLVPPGDLQAAQQLAYDMLAAEGITVDQLNSGGPLSAGKLEAKKIDKADELKAGTIDKPKQIGNFDKEQAEAAADRYLEILRQRQQKPEKLEAGELEEPPPLFARASDYYRQFSRQQQQALSTEE